MGKLNCWEAKKCGKEPGGAKSEESGVCPVALEEKANGIHGGKNGGRACWVVSKSLCGDKVQGSFADKMRECSKCDFYQLVKREEPLLKDKTDILYQMEFGR